jgi:hypothetical protein
MVIGGMLSVLGASIAHQIYLGANTRRRSFLRRPGAEIPVFDARQIGLIGYAEARRAEMLELRDACIGPITPLARPLVSAADKLARRWLANAAHSRIGELDTIARIAESAGVYLLNASYDFGCTTLASPDADDGVPRLLRTLDWPYDGLGALLDIVQQRGEAGEFLNLTWPGAVGVLTAMAPGRFAATINQAPLRRFTRADWSISLDFARTLWNTWNNVRDEPAMHLLRRVFETAPDYQTALTLLAEGRIARPAIFTLVGVKPGESCVIERTEEQAHVRNGIASAANAWRYGNFDGNWEGRGGEDGDLRGDSARRSADIEAFAGRATGHFDWVKPPILNSLTRLAVEMSPATGRLRAQTYESPDGDEAEPYSRLHDQAWPA